MDDLYALEAEGLRPNVILVNLHKDKKLSMLKQLTLTLVKGLHSTPAVVVKKIAGLVRHLLSCCLYWHLVSGRLLFQFFLHHLLLLGLHVVCYVNAGVYAYLIYRTQYIVLFGLIFYILVVEGY